MKALPVRMLIALGLLPLMPGNVLACDCAGIPTIQEAVGRSSAIFAGRVVDVSPTEKASYVTFDVARVWKGNVTRTIQVTDGPPQNSCSLNFKKGEECLVYAYYPEDINGVVSSELSVGPCGRIQNLSGAQSELNILGASYPPLANPFSASPLRWGLAICSLSGIAAVLWFSRKRFNSS